MKYNLTLLSQAAGMFSQSSATLSLHNPVMIPISFLLNIYCPFSRQIKLAICSISAFVLFIIRTPFREYSKTLIFCEKSPLLHTNLESYAKVLRIEKPPENHTPLSCFKIDGLKSASKSIQKPQIFIKKSSFFSFTFFIPGFYIVYSSKMQK